MMCVKYRMSNIERRMSNELHRRKMRCRYRRLFIRYSLFVIFHSAFVIRHSTFAQDTIVGSPHDLSVSGPGDVHALYEEEVCIFCHAPHNASGQAPLWNRATSPSHYRIYESSTTDARIDQPSGVSKMCLSCHDGALALGLVASQPPNEPIVMSRRTLPPGPADLMRDLSDDHPIGFRYDRALANRDPQLKSPETVSRELPLGKHREVHCTTCHDPHNNRLGRFLRITDERSTICLTCHDLQGWHSSSHARSAAPILGRGVDPRERLPYITVADNGCTSCHKIHSADSAERLLRFRRDEDNCLNCHDGGTARTNIKTELLKRSAHPVLQSARRHDPAEDPRVMPRHVECTDCHNPHAVAPDFRTGVPDVLAGVVDAATRGVSGVDRLGRPVERATFAYEICFKCHADGATRPRQGQMVRQITQTNTRLEFQPGNPSFHPVAASRRNSDVVSLIAPLRVGSTIRCTDCHNSDTTPGNGPTAPDAFFPSGGAAGPHGSIFEPLLIDNYSTDDFTLESPRAYALCYRCHERQSILGDESFPLHNVHVVRGRVSCAACHDAHGVSRTQGSARNHGNLINFDLSVVRPVNPGLGARIEYVDTGTYAGNCTLVCHGVTHIRFEYGRNSE